MAYPLDNTRKVAPPLGGCPSSGALAREFKKAGSKMKITALIASALILAACPVEPSRYAYGTGKLPSQRVSCEYAEDRIEKLSDIAVRNETTRFDDELAWYRSIRDRWCNDNAPSPGAV